MGRFDNMKKEKKSEKSKVKEIKKNAGDDEDEVVENGESEEELDRDLGNAEEEVKKLKGLLGGGESIDRVHVKGSKPIGQVRKGDKIKVDGKEFEVDAQYVLIDHGSTKEMAIDIFDKKTDKDYELRYFSDQAETSMEFYELQEILYVRKPCEKVEW